MQWNENKLRDMTINAINKLKKQCGREWKFYVMKFNARKTN